MNQILSSKTSFRWMAFLAIWTVACGAQAVNYTWTGGGGDSLWCNPVNWGGAGAPTNSDDSAYFSSWAAVPYTVEFDRDITNSTIRVYQDNVRLDLNGYTGTFGNVHIARSAGTTGTINVVDGYMKVNVAVNFGYADNSEGTLVLNGPNANLEASMAYLGYGNQSIGIFRIEDGARADITTWNPGYSDTGVGKIFVSNATIAASYLSLGYGTNSIGEMLMTGPDARWLNIGSPAPAVGYKGQGILNVENGAKASYGPLYFYIGRFETATGTVTVTGPGSIIGGPEGEANVRTVTMGASARVEVGGTPAAGGVGTLNLLDGGALQGAGISTAYYFFIADGSRIRIRDGSLKWCADGSSRNGPLYFSPGSYYRVELTENSKAFTADTPLIWSGANVAGATRTNLIENANLEVELADGFAPDTGDVFRIFRYEGDLEGTFAGLPEGSVIKANGARFRINYGARTDDTITLTALPPAGTIITVR